MSSKRGSRTLQKKDVIKAAQINERTFEHWTDRRLIKMSGDDLPGDGKGKPREFGMRTITKLAIAHKIALLGIPANVAVRLASKFTDEPQHGRAFGELFQTGKTILVASSDGVGNIHCVPPDSNIDSLLNGETALVVDIGAIVSNLTFRLATIQ